MCEVTFSNIELEFPPLLLSNMLKLLPVHTFDKSSHCTDAGLVDIAPGKNSLQIEFQNIIDFNLLAAYYQSSFCFLVIICPLIQSMLPSACCMCL